MATGCNCDVICGKLRKEVRMSDRETQYPKRKKEDLITKFYQVINECMSPKESKCPRERPRRGVNDFAYVVSGRSRKGKRASVYVLFGGKVVVRR